MLIHNFKIMLGSFAIMSLFIAGSVQAQKPVVSAEPSSKDSKAEGSLLPDNTGINKRDREQNKLTAEHQAQSSREDEEITRQIREELVKNDKLSMYGQNVKIITLGGIVTLRGPVKSRTELEIIANSARKVAGVRTVHNELEVTK